MNQNQTKVQATNPKPKLDKKIVENIRKDKEQILKTNQLVKK